MDARRRVPARDRCDRQGGVPPLGMGLEVYTLGIKRCGPRGINHVWLPGRLKGCQDVQDIDCIELG